MSHHYGWVIALTSGLILFVAFGIRLSFSVFFVSLIDEFGWSRADTSLIFTTTMIVFTAVSTLAGLALDRYGARTTFTLGAFLLGLGLALSSQIETIQQLAITYGIIAGLGITILGLSMHASLISRWFNKRMNTAIGIAFAGTGLGALILTPLVEWIIRQWSWRVAFLILAGIIFLIIPLIWALVREPQQQRVKKRLVASELNEEKGWTGPQLLRTPSFWLLLLVGICNLSPIRMLTVHQLAIMTDAGIPIELGARAAGLAGLITAVSYIGSGILADRIGRVAMYTVGGTCLIGAIFVISQLEAGLGSHYIWLYAVLLGLGEGSRSSLVSGTVGELFAGRSVGTINGAVGASYGLGTAFLPWYAGFLFDQTQSYNTSLWISVTVVLVAMLSLYLANKVHQPISMSSRI